MIALDPIATPFSVDMSDAIEMRVLAVIYLAYQPPIALRLVCDDGDRPMQPHTLDRFVQKGLCCLCIPPGSQAKVDHPAVGINGSP